MQGNYYLTPDGREVTVHDISAGDATSFMVMYRRPGGSWRPHPGFNPCPDASKLWRTLDAYAATIGHWTYVGIDEGGQEDEQNKV